MTWGNTYLRPLLLGSAAALAFQGGAVAANEATEEQKRELRERLEALKSRIDYLEQKRLDQSNGEKERIAPAQAVTAGEFPGSWKLPGTDTSMSFSGYARVDAFYTIGRPHTSPGGGGVGGGTLGTSFVVSSIARDGTAAAGQGSDVNMHARQSRIRFDTRTPTDWGSLRTRIEGDFDGAGGNERFSNSSLFRLRQAYGQLGPVLAGQTHSTFMDQDTAFDTVDWFGPAGQDYNRQAQIRYTADLIDTLSMDLALENPEQTNIRNVANAASANNNFTDLAPDFIAALRYRPSWGAINVTGVARYFHYTDGVGDSDSALGGGGHVGATLKMPWIGAKDVIAASVQYGKGVNRYVRGAGSRDYVVSNANSGPANTCAGSLSVKAGCGADITLNTALGYWAGFTHYWTNALRSSAYYGEAFNTVDTAKLGAAANGQTNHTRTTHANIMWNPVSRVTVGLEFMHGWNYTAAVTGFNQDKDGQASRVQLGMQYNF
ncbi:MAG: DcaP family trimeric outer membrane transporter [Alphaproteobacteria bacterium]